MFGITVYQVEDGQRSDFVYFERVATAPAMEDRVTKLHLRFPAPGFTFAVERI
ncbi:hypothetical protein [Nonomuraea sp. SBT364]|uniref:hypothetical protein n=1 Tax=Nonomuraea sp. SBT364 TaxID=1580530 RepID=UPI000B0B171B|nr:hypothetical protein [Nonomuraea sp. SBT364]